MMRRILVLLAVAALAAAVLAPAALAEKPVHEGDCTFKNGKTTCTTTTKRTVITTQQYDYVQRFCPGVGYKLVPVLRDFQTDVTETTTTTYRGKGNQVESSETTTSEVGPYPIGTYYAGSC